MDEEKIKSSTEPDSLHLVHWDHYYSKIPSKNSGEFHKYMGTMSFSIYNQEHQK